MKFPSSFNIHLQKYRILIDKSKKDGKLILNLKKRKRSKYFLISFVFQVHGYKKEWDAFYQSIFFLNSLSPLTLPSKLKGLLLVRQGLLWGDLKLAFDCTIFSLTVAPSLGGELCSLNMYAFLANSSLICWGIRFKVKSEIFSDSWVSFSIRLFPSSSKSPDCRSWAILTGDSKW